MFVYHPIIMIITVDGSSHMSHYYVPFVAVFWLREKAR